MFKNNKLFIGLDLDVERLKYGGIWSFFTYFEVEDYEEKSYGIMILFFIIGFKKVYIQDVINNIK